MGLICLIVALREGHLSCFIGAILGKASCLSCCLQMLGFAACCCSIGFFPCSPLLAHITHTLGEESTLLQCVGVCMPWLGCMRATLSVYCCPVPPLAACAFACFPLSQNKGLFNHAIDLSSLLNAA